MMTSPRFKIVPCTLDSLINRASMTMRRRHRFADVYIDRSRELELGGEG